MRLYVVEEGLIIRPETVEDGVEVGRAMIELGNRLDLSAQTTDLNIKFGKRQVDLEDIIADVDNLLGGPVDDVDRLNALKLTIQDAKAYRNPGANGL